jgi:hypothetical protein
MRSRSAVRATLATLLFVGSALAADAPKSGPQPGEGCGVFEPLNVTGRFAGKKQCLV